jgi:hypothetical protein
MNCATSTSKPGTGAVPGDTGASGLISLVSLSAMVSESFLRCLPATYRCRAGKTVANGVLL